jgi:Phosphoesterase family
LRPAFWPGWPVLASEQGGVWALPADIGLVMRMRVVNRRRFLQLAGGSVAATMLSDSIARALAIPANRATGTLEDVEHIVVLMQENRSFDHYFGVMRGVRGFGDPHPAVLPSGQPVWYQADGANVVLPFRPDVGNLALTFIEDLDHSWNGTHEMFNGGNWDQWLPAKTTTCMAHMERSDLPFHYALADAFTVCDGYHCRRPGSAGRSIRTSARGSIRPACGVSRRIHISATTGTTRCCTSSTTRTQPAGSGPRRRRVRHRPAGRAARHRRDHG